MLTVCSSLTCPFASATNFFYQRVAEGGGEEQPSPQPVAAAPAASVEESSEAGRAADGEGPTPGDKSLEEVAEAHLSDSYWTT